MTTVNEFSLVATNFLRDFLGASSSVSDAKVALKSSSSSFHRLPPLRPLLPVDVTSVSWGSSEETPALLYIINS